jgi:hypothetical protein
MASPANADDARTEFLNKVSELVDFWDRDARVGSRTERLEGLAYSVLSLIGNTPPDALSEGIHDQWGELRYGLCPA